MEYSIYDAVRAGFTKVVFIIKPEMRGADAIACAGTVCAHNKTHGEPLEVCYAIAGLHQHTGLLHHSGGPHQALRHGPCRAVRPAHYALTSPSASSTPTTTTASMPTGPCMRSCCSLPATGTGHHGGVSAEKHRQRSTAPCPVACAGWRTAELRGIQEALKIQLYPDGSIADVAEGQHRELAPDTVVSMNFWGFMPSHLSRAGGLL